MIKVVEQVTRQIKVVCCDLCGKQAQRKSWFTGKIFWDDDNENRIVHSRTYWSFPGILPRAETRDQEYVLCPDCFYYKLGPWLESQKKTNE